MQQLAGAKPAQVEGQDVTAGRRQVGGVECMKGGVALRGFERLRRKSLAQARLIRPQDSILYADHFA